MSTFTLPYLRLLAASYLLYRTTIVNHVRSYGREAQNALKSFADYIALPNLLAAF